MVAMNNNVREQACTLQDTVIMKYRDKRTWLHFTNPWLRSLPFLCVLKTITGSPATSGSSTTSAPPTDLNHDGAIELADFTGAAIQYFNSERVTAALIAGASLSALFSLTKYAKEVGVTPRVKDDYHQTLTWVLTRFYHSLCLTAVLLNLNVVLTTTMASTTLLLEKHNGMAYNAYEFLFRELGYEFITTQWSSIVGLLCFTASLAMRSLLEFDLIRKGKRRSGLFVILSFAALMAHLLSYINSSLHQWPNLGVMTVDFCKTVIDNALNRDALRPLELLSIIFAASSIFVFVTRIYNFDTTTIDLPVVETSTSNRRVAAVAP